MKTLETRSNIRHEVSGDGLEVIQIETPNDLELNIIRKRIATVNSPFGQELIGNARFIGDFSILNPSLK